MNKKELITKKQGFEETAIDIIKDSNIISPEDFNILSEKKEELKDSFLNAQMFRTRTEMEVSVLNNLKHPTPDSKYWQSVREQNVMFEQLTLLSYEYRKKVIEIKKLEKKLKKERNELEKELIQIDIEKNTFELRMMEKQAKARLREIEEWSDIKERLKNNMQYSLKNCDEHQLISYTKRWIKQSISMGERGSPSERQNLHGQLRSGIKKCIDKKVLHKVLIDFNEDILNKIALEYGLDATQLESEVLMLKESN